MPGEQHYSFVQMQVLMLMACHFLFTLEPELESRYISVMSDWGWQALGTALCVAAAGVLSLAFRGSPMKGLLPLLFVAIIFLVATRFGSAPGILGTIGAAVVFAEFLFEPRFSLRVSDSIQRNNLVWMMIIGISGSELLGMGPKSRGGSKDISSL